MTLPPLPFEAKPPRRLHQPSAEEFWSRAFEEPLVLTGCMEDWRLLRELRASDTFARKLGVLGPLFGEKPVTFHQMPRRTEGHYHFQKDRLEGRTFGQPARDVPFDVFARQLLRSLEGGSDDYVYLQSHLVEQGTPLRESLGPRILPFLKEQQAFPRMWIGSNGQVVNLHYDDFVNFICMVEGTKRVTLFAPELLPSMYHAPFDDMLEQAQASHVRLLEPDLERFPRFREALREARVAVVNPGEVLYIPPMWWHHVESFGLNVMVNNWVFEEHFDLVVQMQENLTRAIRLFIHHPSEQRARELEHYRRTVFAPGVASTPKPAEDGNPLARHRAETRELVARMPDFLRRQVALYYEHFVFQVSGDPIPSQPGAFAAMVERKARVASFFARE
ncbi:cupin-like domain-containing protein [Archangium violaceum]|uniref:cupin-like domain-containing protein n=1 Tax=Archangium violaceum TaxID=83451 RepID=UPI001950CBCC|nr:cupin-like domain-containing protein [Archangium violaceum]QRN95009.1 cupin-like domain-containing protein [Archangium violaceum]